MTIKRLDIDGLVTGDISIYEYGNSGFVKEPINKHKPHPSLYFKGLFLTYEDTHHVKSKHVVEALDVSQQHFSNFLEEQLDVTNALAQKLSTVTGMPKDFWLRTQYHYDSSNNLDKDNVK